MGSLKFLQVANMTWLYYDTIEFQKIRIISLYRDDVFLKIFYPPFYWVTMKKSTFFGVNYWLLIIIIVIYYCEECRWLLITTSLNWTERKDSLANNFEMCPSFRQGHLIPKGMFCCLLLFLLIYILFIYGEFSRLKK